MPNRQRWYRTIDLRGTVRFRFINPIVMVIAAGTISSWVAPL
jgi:hypothetical protein